MSSCATQYRGEGIRQPDGRRPGPEQPDRIGSTRFGNLGAGNGTEHDTGEPGQGQRKQRGRGKRNQAGVQHEGGRLVATSGAERTGNRSGHTAAHRARRHLLHQLGEGQYDGPTGEGGQPLARGQP